MSLAAQPGVVSHGAIWMRPSFKEDDAISLVADLTETGRYGTMLAGRTQ